MLDQAYAQKEGIAETLKYSHNGDAVYIETTGGKAIVLASTAYVMLEGGMMIQVSKLVPKMPLANVGRIKGMKIVGGRHLLYNEKHERTTVNGFVCALWRREVYYHEYRKA